MTNFDIPETTSASSHNIPYWDAALSKADKGWFCPGCHRVYAYWVSECWSCNHLIDKNRITTAEERICTKCGGEMAFIRGRFPSDAKRIVCPTCQSDILRSIHDQSDPDVGKSYQLKAEKPKSPFSRLLWLIRNHFRAKPKYAVTLTAKRLKQIMDSFLKAKPRPVLHIYTPFIAGENFNTFLPLTKPVAKGKPRKYE